MRKSNTESSHPWSSSWLSRLRELLSDAGFESVSALLASIPGRPYREVARVLDESVAPIQLIAAAYAEAKTEGTVREIAQDGLCRNIVEKCESGWGVGENAEWKTIKALSGWCSEVVTTGDNPNLDTIVSRIARRIREMEIPTGWIPQDSSDPIIEQVFGEIWRTKCDE